MSAADLERARRARRDLTRARQAFLTAIAEFNKAQYGLPKRSASYRPLNEEETLLMRIFSVETSSENYLAAFQFPMVTVRVLVLSSIHKSNLPGLLVGEVET